MLSQKMDSMIDQISTLNATVKQLTAVITKQFVTTNTCNIIKVILFNYQLILILESRQLTLIYQILTRNYLVLVVILVNFTKNLVVNQLEVNVNSYKRL